MTHETLQRFAAPAPTDPDDDAAERAEEASALGQQPDLHALCLDWVAWCHTRNFYVRPSLPASLLGRLTSKGTGRGRGTGPDAIAGADLMAFHLAFLAQPEEALDRRAFELHYYRRVRNIKAAAQAMGVSRQHWYRLVADCRQRIYIASKQILERNLCAGEQLASRVAQPADED